jgi:hypothetical protein
MIKSIVEVDVDTAKFARFQELFSRYETQLGKTPNAWKAVGKESAAMATQFERMAAALMAQNQLSKEGKDADEKRLKQMASTEKLWTSMSHSAKSVAKSVLDIGAGLLKWGTLIGGGLLGGSLFGLDRLGASVSDQRRTSMGLGLSIGERAAFKTNFGRVVDPDSFLGMVNEMQSDPRKSWSLYSMGINPNGKSTEDLSVSLLKAMRQRAQATPVNQLGLLGSMTGIGVGTDTWRRLHDMKSGEFNQLLSGNRQDIGALGFRDPVALKWQNFTTQMERAGQSIFKTFVLGLAPLADPLKHLSAAFVEFLGKVTAKNGVAQEGINNLAGWIESFSGKISKPEFLSSIDQLVSDSGRLAGAIHTVADAVDHPAEAAGKAVASTVKADFLGGHAAMWSGLKLAGSWIGQGFDALTKNTGALARVGALDAKYGLPSGALEYVWGKESSSRMDAPDRAGGASGPFQLKPGVSGGIDRHSFYQSSERAAQLLAQELKRYKGDIVKAIAAYNLGDPTLDKLIGQYGANWQKHAPYVAGITINNNTGGNAITTVSAQ